MTEYVDLTRETHLERLKVAWATVLEGRPHANIATVGTMPDGTIQPFVSESWAAYVHMGGVNDLGKNYLAFLCDHRRRKIENIKNPPVVNGGVAFVAGQIAVTQRADPVWAVGYRGEARMVAPDDPMYDAFIDNWLSTGRFAKDRLNNYLHASGAAVGAHTIAAVELKTHEPMNGLTTVHPRYEWWGSPFCKGKEPGIDQVPYEHLCFPDAPSENVFEYVWQSRQHTIME